MNYFSNWEYVLGLAKFFPFHQQSYPYMFQSMIKTIDQHYILDIRNMCKGGGGRECINMKVGVRFGFELRVGAIT